VSVGGAGVYASVGLGLGVGVSVGEGEGDGEGDGDGDGDGVAVGSGSRRVGPGEGVGVVGEAAVLNVQNSVISGSSPDLMYTSRHAGSVSVSVSSAQVTAPSSTVRRVVSSMISILIREGTFRSFTRQAGVTNSYEGFCATNRRLPSCSTTCKRGKVCGFCTSTMVSGVSSSVLSSPR